MTVLIITVYGIVVYFTVIPLIKRKLWRDLVVSSFLIIAAFTLMMLYNAGVKLPDPANALANLFGSMNLKFDIK